MWWLIVLIILVLLAAAYVFAVAPGKKRDRSPLLGYSYAHRGLHENGTDHPENSLAAFSRAAECGYGIEFDVQLTKDNVLLVFHDDSLLRICGEDVRICDMTFEETRKYRLLSTEERIPTLDETLELIGGRSPLIVEIKNEKRIYELTEATYKRLSRYSAETGGVYCVESFNPFAIVWLRKHAPEVIRGQLSTGVYPKMTFPSLFQQIILSLMLLNVSARPDFFARDINHDRVPAMAVCRLFGGLPVAWTVRDQQTFDRLKDRYPIQIFEGFTP